MQLKTNSLLNGNPLQYSCLENPMDGGTWCPWGHKVTSLSLSAYWKACLGESLKLTLSMSLKYTANFVWDLSLGQIRTSSKGEKGGQRDILNLKQKTIRLLSICMDLCMSQCVFFGLFDNIAEVANEFYFNCPKEK